MVRRPASFYSEEKPAVTLKTALAEFLKKSGLQAADKHPQVERAWEDIVGPFGQEIVSHTRVLGFRRGIVTIGVDSSALMNEIRFHRTTLLAELQRKIKRPAIVGISFSLIPTQERDDGSAEI